MIDLDKKLVETVREMCELNYKLNELARLYISQMAKSNDSQPLQRGCIFGCSHVIDNVLDTIKKWNKELFEENENQN